MVWHWCILIQAACSNFAISRSCRFSSKHGGLVKRGIDSTFTIGFGKKTLRSWVTKNANTMLRWLGLYWIVCRLTAYHFLFINLVISCLFFVNSKGCNRVNTIFWAGRQRRNFLGEIVSFKGETSPPHNSCNLCQSWPFQCYFPTILAPSEITFVSFLIHLSLRYFQVNTLMLQIQRILLNRTGKMSYECTNNMFLRDNFHLLISKNYLFDSSVFLEEARGPSRRGNSQQDWNWSIFSHNVIAKIISNGVKPKYLQCFKWKCWL